MENIVSHQPSASSAGRSIAPSPKPRARVVVLGSANVDVMLRVGAIPEAGETVLSADAALRPGGKGANQAVAAALAGADVLFLGSIGDDEHGASIRTALVAAGVDDRLLRTVPGRSSGLAIVMVAPDGENAIAVSPGANHSIGAADVLGLAGELGPGDVLLAQMELPPDVVARAVELAADARATAVVNLAPAVRLPASVLEAVQVLIVNRSEAQFLLGHTLPGPDGARAATADLLKLGPEAVVLTIGGDGAFVGDAEGVMHVPPLQVDVVDTAGAGDAFVGVLVAELSRGRPLRTAVYAATAAGAAAVQSHGAQLTSLTHNRGLYAQGGH